MLDSVHLGIVLNLTQNMCTVCAKSTTASENPFGRTRWNSMVTWVLWNLVLIHLVKVLVSVQDRCMVCTKHNIGFEIILDALDGSPR
jgi:hypothetical protein